MAKNKMHISTQETTILKIEMASRAIKQENNRRWSHNEKREKLLKKGKSAPEKLPILKPDFIHVARKTPKHIALGTKGMDTVFKSNKYLCGALSVLCDTLRGVGIAYPWREQEGV